MVVSSSSDRSFLQSLQKTARGEVPTVLDELISLTNTHPTCITTTCCQNGATPLHIAAQANNVKFLDSCFRLKLGTHVQDKAGNTPLHYAVKSNSIDAVKTLLSHGRKEILLDKVNNEGLTALALACSKHQPEIVFALLRATPSLNIVYPLPTPLHCLFYHRCATFSDLCKSNSVDEMLLDHGADPNQKCEGNVPLEYFLEDVFAKIYFKVFHCGNMELCMKKVSSHISAGLKLSNLSTSTITKLGKHLLNAKFYVKYRVDIKKEIKCEEALKTLSECLDLLHSNREFQVDLSMQTCSFASVKLSLPKEMQQSQNGSIFNLLKNYVGLPRLEDLAAAKIRQILRPNARFGTRELERQGIIPQHSRLISRVTGYTH